MKLFLTLIFFLSVNSARADFIFAPGLQAISADRSEETNGIGKSHLNLGAGGGLLADLELLIGAPFGLNLELGWTGHAAKVQYNNTHTNVSADDLKTSATLLTAMAGPRLRIINFKRFKTYVGGGFLLGHVALTYDEKDFEKKVGNTAGFKDTEGRSFNGHYLEAGIEVILTNKSAFRLAGKSLKYKTGEFYTLSDQTLALEQYSVGIQYMHYVDMSFFWK